jgi:hypothetical protein
VQYLDRIYTSQDWITLLLLCCIVITTIVKIAYPLRFQEFLKLPLSNKYFFVFGKNDAIYHLFNVLLFIPQAICVSLLLYKVIAWQNPTMLLETSFLFIKILGVFTGFVVAKIILEKTIGIVFNIENIIHQYVYQKLSYRNLMSILFIIMLFVVAYIAPINKAILLTFCLITVVINAIALFYSYKTNGKLIIANFFYFILYLCALEISPYIILYKMFV